MIEDEIRILHNEIVRGIEYKKWNLEYVPIKDGIGNRVYNVLKFVPKWLNEDDEDYLDKIIVIGIYLNTRFTFKSSTSDSYPEENGVNSIVELLDKIKAFYDFEE